MGFCRVKYLNSDIQYALGWHVNFGIKTLIFFLSPECSLLFPVRKEETVISRNVRDMKWLFESSVITDLVLTGTL